MESVRTVLREADQMEKYGAHLCAVARNMMELFHVIYASIHEKKAQELPYLAGTEGTLPTGTNGLAIMISLFSQRFISIRTCTWHISVSFWARSTII